MLGEDEEAQQVGLNEPNVLQHIELLIPRRGEDEEEDTHQLTMLRLLAYPRRRKVNTTSTS